MPTTPHEAQRIAALIQEYLGPRVAEELTKRLHREVGRKTSNESLQISLEMLYKFFKKK